MKKCANCKFSEKYFRGLLCHYIEEKGAPALPAYLTIVGAEFAPNGLSGCYPRMIDEKDYAEYCRVYEERCN